MFLISNCLVSFSHKCKETQVQLSLKLAFLDRLSCQALKSLAAAKIKFSCPFPSKYFEVVREFLSISVEQEDQFWRHFR